MRSASYSQAKRLIAIYIQQNIVVAVRLFRRHENPGVIDHTIELAALLSGKIDYIRLIDCHFGGCGLRNAFYTRLSGDLFELLMICYQFVFIIKLVI